MKKMLSIVLIIFCCVSLSNCALVAKAKRVDGLEDEVLALQNQLNVLKDQNEKNLTTLKDKQTKFDKLSKEKEEALKALNNVKVNQSNQLILEKDRYTALERELIEVKNQSKEALAKQELELTSQLDTKQKEILNLKKQKEEELSKLEQAKNDLAITLKKELNNYKAKLEMTERGLVITFLAEIFFDSGKDIIHNSSKSTLKRVAEVLNNKISDSPLAVEGHTDNVPIRYSGWKSNWELSVARSLAVLHYFIDEAEVRAGRLSAVGYGEFKPVASNTTEEGKQQNRRVEIVILPSQLKKIKDK